MSPLIDLGEVFGEQTAADTGETQGPPVSATMRRTLVALALALTTVFTVAAANPGSPTLTEPLWTGQVSLLGFGLSERSVFSYQTDGAVALAHDLHTGEPRWRLDLDDLPIEARSVGDGLAVVLTRGVRTPDGAEDDPTVTVLDDATGAVLGRTSGVPIGSTASGLVLIVASRRPADPFDPDGLPRCPGRVEICTVVSGWDRGARGEAWRTTLPGYVITDEWPGDVRWLAAVTPSGMVQMHDARTGAVMGQLVLPAEFVRGYQIALIRDTLVVAMGGQNSIQVTGFAVDSLRRVWQVEVPAGLRHPGYLGWFYPSRCGPLLCLQTDWSTVVVDLGQGVVQTTVSARVLGALGGGALLATPTAPPMGPNVSIRERPTVVLLDQADGRTLVAFADSQVVPWPDSAGRALVAQSGADRTAFTLVDEWGGRVALGSVAGIGLDCRVAADVLACADSAGRLRVWRLTR